MSLLLIFAFSAIKCNLKDMMIETLLFACLLKSVKFHEELIKFILETEFWKLEFFLCLWHFKKFVFYSRLRIEGRYRSFLGVKSQNVELFL